MPAKRKIPSVACPDHRGSTVQGWGKRTVAGQVFQRYRCRSAAKSRGIHYFLAPITGGEVLVSRPAWTRPPRCEKHAGGRVIRHGPYGGKVAGRARQRYLCSPGCREHPVPCPSDCAQPSKCRTHRKKPCTPGCAVPRHCVDHVARCPKTCESRPHTFTPALARRWIEGHGFADACDHCEQPRGVHHGEANAARHHSFTSLTVAEGIVRMSGGDTYGETGLWALRERRGTRARRSDGSAGKPASRARANNVWHVAADWVECFAPVLYGPLDTRLRELAVAERARLDAAIRAGGRLEKPIIWVADEMVIGKKGAEQQAFVVLLVAQVEWADDDGEPIVRLRLARAMPDKSMTAWLVALHELAGREGIWPDFLVCDYSSALLGAAAARLGPQVRWVPSLWHLSRAIRSAFWGRKDPIATPRPIERHLAELTRGSDAMSSPAGWQAWWTTLGDLFEAEGKPRKIVETRREIYGPPFDAAIPDLVGTWGPLSNAAIESIQRTRLRRIFESRDHAMTSVERTNALLDLVVAREHGQLDSIAEVARLLREDAHAHGGWSTPPRSINDPANPNDRKDRYKSLRDRSLSQRLVFERGIA